MKIRNRLRGLRLFVLLALILVLNVGGTDPRMKMAKEFKCEKCLEENTSGTSRQRIEVFPPIIRVLPGESNKSVLASSTSDDPAEFSLPSSKLKEKKIPRWAVEVVAEFDSGGTKTGSVTSALIDVQVKSLDSTGVSQIPPVNLTVSAVFDETGQKDSAVFQVLPVFPRIVWPISARKLKPGVSEIPLKVLKVVNPALCTWVDLTRDPAVRVLGINPAQGQEVTLTLEPQRSFSNSISIVLELRGCGQAGRTRHFLAVRNPL